MEDPRRKNRKTTEEMVALFCLPSIKQPLKRVPLPLVFLHLGCCWETLCTLLVVVWRGKSNHLTAKIYVFAPFPTSQPSNNPPQNGHQLQKPPPQELGPRHGGPSVRSRRLLAPRGDLGEETRPGELRPSSPFFGGGFPTKIDYRKTSTLILTSLLEHQVEDFCIFRLWF